MLIKLYLNDPAGNRWNHISDLVRSLKKKYAFEVEIVKKSSFGLMERMKLPKFPAVEIDGAVVFEGRDITAEELESEIAKRIAP